MRIDAHQHYWRIGRNGQEWPTPDLATIYRDFVPADLEPQLGGARTVLVQSQPDDADTDWMLALAVDRPSIAAVVGWTDLLAPDAPQRIAALAARPKLRGIRPMLQSLPPEWILDPALAPAIAAMTEHRLVFDALVKPQHLPALHRFAAAHPDLRIVIDHAAKPDIAVRAREPWATDMAALAALPNIACKLSGLATEAAPGWRDDDLRPYVDHLLAAFGPDRLLWGSDWPVLLLAGDYAGWLACAERLVPQADHPAIFGGNARRLYRVD